jgi:FixJ family two-component response regulator
MPLTRMQRYVLAQRLDGVRPKQIAERLGITAKAVYRRDQRARKALTDWQRTRYAKAIKRVIGPRTHVRPKSLSFLGC